MNAPVRMSIAPDTLFFWLVPGLGMRNWLAASSNARNPQQVPTVLEPLQQGAALETNAVFGFADAQATGQQQSRRDYPRLWRGPAA